jgi:hypothetical protein
LGKTFFSCQSRPIWVVSFSFISTSKLVGCREQL